MVPLLSLWWLGLEASRFPSADDGVDAAVGTVGLLGDGPGVASLPPYRGPALQPTLAYQHGALELGLAPALHLSADPETDTRVRQYLVELRPRWRGEVGFAGLDLGVSGGVARRDGTPIARGDTAWRLAATAGARAPLGDHLALSGRALWHVTTVEGTWTQGLGGAAALEWRR